MGRAFISYSSKDKRSLEEVANFLRDHDVSVVVNSRTPAGTLIADTINTAVGQSDCCILLLSQHSKGSTWCMAEVGAFWHARKPIFIYHLEDPHVAVPELLAGIAWANSLGDLAEACRGVRLAPARDPRSLELLDQCGLTLFRIPDDNPHRQKRVEELIREEIEHAERGGSRPCFRLSASSGHSYVHPAGPVWNDLGLYDAVVNHNALLRVVLESPFSPFSLTRALANDADSHNWGAKVDLPHLKGLVAQHGAEIRVTEHPVNCSLFLTSHAVYYDPYLWARGRGAHTENNFFVFEFRRTNPNADCHGLLAGHFDFLLRHSALLGDFLVSDPDLRRRTHEFEDQLRALRTRGTS